MRRNTIETLMGAVVIAVAALFLVFAYSTASLRQTSGYAVQAQFDRIDGIRTGSDIRLSGIKVGSVSGSHLDPKTYLAVVVMSIDPGVQLPLDTSATITSDGLLGDKYLALSPGGSDKMIQPGGVIENTQGSIDIFSLVGQLIFSQTGDKNKKGEGGK